MSFRTVVERALQDEGGKASGPARTGPGDVGRSMFAVGKNAETLAVHGLWPLDGIIDDFAEDGGHWQGIPLVDTHRVPRDATIVNCSTSISPVAVMDHLAASGFGSVTCYHDLVRASHGSLPWPGFVAAQRRELREHMDAWQAIHDALHDDESRQTLLDVALYRLSSDPRRMHGYRVRMEEQYFEGFMEYKREVFVDAGGFDGDTSEAFANRHPDYERILFFEPSPSNMESARIRLSGLRGIEYFPVGLSDGPGVLRFSPGEGSASAIREDGTDSIRVDALDALTDAPVSVIKMDLEGWEMPALDGARGHIRDTRPKLAIAAYHDSSDIRRIYQFVEHFGHGYKVFLRHYTQGWSETVMYFVP